MDEVITSPIFTPYENQAYIKYALNHYRGAQFRPLKQINEKVMTTIPPVTFPSSISDTSVRKLSESINSSEPMEFSSVIVMLAIGMYS
jgi:hypothetical protein